MRTWNLIWISMISLVLALPAEARVGWFPSDVQDVLPQQQAEEEALPDPNVSPATPCAADDESCPKSEPTPGSGEDLSTEPTVDGSPELVGEESESEADEVVPKAPEEGIRGPRPPTGVDFDPPSWLESLLESLEDLKFPDWTGTALKTLGWILLGILILFALITLIRAFWPRKHSELPAEEDSLLSELQARTKNREANELAKVHDFNLAIHALLLDALRKLETRHPIIRSPSATGREIARDIDPSPESPLLQLVKASEMCVFAVSIADEELYQRAQEWHRAIVSGL